MPEPRVAARWAERTPKGFEFSIKLYQKFTHPAMFKAASHPTSTDVTVADLDLVRRSLAPLQEAGKLGVLLAQFPPRFKNERTNRDYVAWLLAAFSEIPVAVELRHRSWSDDVADTLNLLNGLGAAWVQIDEPKFRFSIAQNYLPNVGSLYYMRLHGRNTQQWWNHDRAEDRYNYYYSGHELKPFSETVDAASRIVKKLYLYMNDHFAAKAVANAVVLRNQLGLPPKGEFGPSFVERYPEVANIVPRAATATLLDNPTGITG